MTTDSSQSHLPALEKAARREKYTFRIGLWTGVLFSVIAVVSTISTIQTGLFAFGGIAITGIIAAISFATAYLARRGKAGLGSATLVSSILLLSLSLPLLAKGQGVALAALTVIVVSSIASYTLDQRWALRATIASVIVGLSVILADIFLPDFGIPHDPQVTNIISLVAGAIYALIILRRFGTYPLQTKFIIAFLVVTLIPIAILSVYSNVVTRNILTKQADANLENIASATALKIDTYLASQLDTVRTEAQQPGLVNFLQPGATDEPEAQATALQTLFTFIRKDPVFILSYALLDERGVNILSTDPTQIGQDESKYDYYKAPFSDGIPYASNLIFKSDYATLYFSAPIRTENGVIVGVLRAEYNAIVLQNIIKTAEIGQQKQTGEKIVLVDRTTFLRIAGTEKQEKIYQSFKNFSPQQVIGLQQQQKLPPGNYTEVIETSFELVHGIENIANQPTFNLPIDAKNGIRIVGSLVSSQPWVVTAQQPESTIYAQAESQARANTLWALGLTMFAFLAALGAARIVSRPVVALAKVAKQITRGDLTARSDISTDDEVGQLSLAFNEMTNQLGQTLSGLEQRVEERTLALQIVNEQSAQRARQLQSIADISKIITREQNIEKLLPLITDAVSDQFGYYHVGIFLLDETRRTAVLQASNSLGGQKMITDGYKLTIGTGSIVGYTALTRKPRIALDVGEDAVFFNNPNLPETHSEMTLPLIIRGEVIGVIDLQSKKAEAFTQEDIDTFSILADQIAIAIENARLFQQTKLSLEEAQDIAQTYLRQEWAALAKKQTTVGYLHTGTGGKALASPIQSEEIAQAIHKGVVIRKDKNANQSAKVAIPIKLGEQIIGAILVQAPDQNRIWSTEEINLLRSISERVGLALDNARLVASSQKRASKERTIEEISQRISAAADMETILQTAVQEIGRALSSADVVIQLKESEEEDEE